MRRGYLGLSIHREMPVYKLGAAVDAAGAEAREARSRYDAAVFQGGGTDR